MVSPSTYNALMLQPLKSGAVVALTTSIQSLILDMTLGIVRLALRTLVPSTEQAF